MTGTFSGSNHEDSKITLKNGTPTKRTSHNTLTDASKTPTSKYNSRMWQHQQIKFFSLQSKTKAETIILTRNEVEYILTQVYVEPTYNVRLQKDSLTPWKMRDTQHVFLPLWVRHNRAHWLAYPLMHNSRLSLHVKIFVAFQLLGVK